MIKWMVVCSSIILAICLIVATLLFLFVIKKKSTTALPRDSYDLMSTTIRAYIVFGDQWLKDSAVQQLTLHTKDNIDLNGYFVPAKRPSKKLAVLIHGYGADARIMATYGKIYQDLGYHVFIADNRGHGKSGGEYVGMGWLDRLDYLEWLNLLIGKLGKDTQIILHGISMGGAAVMMISGEQLPQQVICMIEDCGMTSVNDEFKYQLGKMFHLPPFPVLSIASLECKLFAGYSFAEASSLEQVKKSKTPILFIHGGADTYNPTWMVHEVYNAAICEKKLLIIPGAMHLMSLHDAPELYVNTVKQFIGKYVSPN